MLGLLWLLLTFLIGSLFVVGIPIFARAVPFSYERKVADYIGDLTQFSECGNPMGRLAFNKIIARLYPVLEDDAKTPLTFRVIEGKDVNAFASLGGHIYVFNGLIQQARSAEEIAGVLAHEIEHVRNRHVIEGVFFRFLTVEAVDLALGRGGGMDPRMLNMLVNMQFGRDQEKQADRDGLRRLQRAKIDVSGFRQFFERESNQTSVPEILSDHPAPENRAELTRQYEGGAIVPLLSPEEWKDLKRYCASPRSAPRRR